MPYDTLAFYEGALQGALREAARLCEALESATKDAESLKYRLEGQFSDLTDSVAAGPWQPISTAPKDGTAVLLRFEDGRHDVCSYRDGVWVLHNYPEIIQDDGPLQWAQLWEKDDAETENRNRS